MPRPIYTERLKASNDTNPRRQDRRGNNWSQINITRSLEVNHKGAETAKVFRKEFCSDGGCRATLFC